LPLEGNPLFHSELATVARQKEKRKWLDKLVKKIGVPLKRRILPLEGNPLFHSELATELKQKKQSRPRACSIFLSIFYLNSILIYRNHSHRNFAYNV
jgi:hypothetical protein